MRITRFLLILLLISGVRCEAQSPAPSAKADSALDRQIKLTIRSQYNVPPDYTLTLGQRSKSDITGYDTLPVIFSNGHGANKTTEFLISKNNNTLARLEKFDLTQDPMANVSLIGRPVRGNPKAPVTIVSFDDLECPFCAEMNELLFPTTQQHYGNQVRFIYKDFPLPIHPWAMRAAVDVNCMAAQSRDGYWNLVDYIHSHGSEISGDRGQQSVSSAGQQSVSSANEKLDQATQQEGQRQKVDMKTLNDCIAKQDESTIRASIKQGNSLGVDGTPTLFINGERATGALPQEMLWSTIDRALTDAGQTPPPRSTPAEAAPAAPAGK